MSKENETGLPENNPGGQTTENQPDANSAGSEPDKGKGKNVLAIEEHQKTLNIAAPVFEAVMKAKGWVREKKVSEAVFKKAVEECLKAQSEGAEKNIRTIEEHKENLGIDAPVFAAVMQTQKWGSGKKVPEAVFKNAVDEFMGAPMDGTKKNVPAVEEHKKDSNAHPEGGK